jgi:hypothetical protein
MTTKAQRYASLWAQQPKRPCLHTTNIMWAVSDSGDLRLGGDVLGVAYIPDNEVTQIIAWLRDNFEEQVQEPP